MTTDLATQHDMAGVIEQVVVGGDLSKLSPKDRLTYYNEICKSVGLNPLTRPFEYLSLSGKLVLYAKRDCTDQLRSLRGVSITKLERETMEGVYTVTAYATDGKGRTDSAIGAVPIEGLRGEAKANAIMKAETKSKRRVTLSICGLGMLDETEVESISDARRVPVDTATGEILETRVVTAAPEQEPLSGFDAPGLPTRAELLGELMEAARLAKYDAQKRSEMWRQFCGKATRETVDVSALADLVAAVKADKAA